MFVLIAILTFFCEVGAEYLCVTRASALSPFDLKSWPVLRSAQGSPEHILETTALTDYWTMQDIKEEREVKEKEDNNR